MNDLIAELGGLHQELHDIVEEATDSSVSNTLDILLERVEKLDRASSKVWRRNHAHLYYKDFQQPPSGKDYLTQGPFPTVLRTSTSSAWINCSAAKLANYIEDGLDQQIICRTAEICSRCEAVFDAKRSEVMSCIEIANYQHGSHTLSDLLTDVDNLSIRSMQEIIRSKRPSPVGGTIIDGAFVVSGDEVMPNHIDRLARVLRMVDIIEGVKSLCAITQKAVSHMERANATPVAPLASGNSVFIGHGRDKSWLQLRNFIKETLRLPVTAYEEESAAGYEIYEHVKSRVCEAAIAFLVMTGEDAVIDSEDNEKRHPRLNVVHELGICQAMLGKERAITLLEKGCEAPSNIIGINHIPFEKGNIMSASEEIRRVLAREELLK